VGRKKREWLEDLSNLYKMIENWMKEIDIEIKYEEIALFEEIRKTAKPIQWTWKIAIPPPNIKYINLNKDTFSDRLLEVVGAD